MTRQNLVPTRDITDAVATTPVAAAVDVATADASDGGSEPPAMCNTLIPFWDMANHDQGRVSTDFEPENNGVSVCYAQRNFAKGEQLTIFYGVRANCDLLIHNGFVFLDNQQDCLTLRLGVAKTDPLAAPRLALLDRLGIVSQKFHLRRTAEPLDGKLMAFLRVLQMDLAQIAEWQNSDESEKLLQVECVLSMDVKVMQYMITRAALLLRAYPTTLQQDQITVKDTKDEVEKLTCQLHLCEKRILVNCVAYCEQALKSLQNNVEA